MLPLKSWVNDDDDDDDNDATMNEDVYNFGEWPWMNDRNEVSNVNVPKQAWLKLMLWPHAATIQSQLIHFSYLCVSYGQKPTPQIKALL